MVQKNTPLLWLSDMPAVLMDGHKYDRGCVLVFGGECLTGAARLAAAACMRVGAGVCVVSAPKPALSIYRTALPAHIMVEPFKTVDKALKDPRRNAVVVGPGLGAGCKKKVMAVLKSKRPAVVDADALSVFAGKAGDFLSAVHGSCILTPHEGEFAKLFPALTGPRIERAAKAAEMSGAVIVLKGHETVIAAPGMEPVVNEINAPYLATAGSGDVLAGMIAGLVAQGMPSQFAACAAVHIHTAAASMVGRGLVASDLPEVVPYVLRELG